MTRPAGTLFGAIALCFCVGCATLSEARQEKTGKETERIGTPPAPETPPRSVGGVPPPGAKRDEAPPPTSPLPALLSAIAAVTSAIVVVITARAAHNRSVEAQVRSDVDTFRQLRAQFLTMRATAKELPKDWARFTWIDKDESKETFEKLALYWINCFDEWFVTSGVIARKRLTSPFRGTVPNNALWVHYYQAAIKKAMDQCPTLLAALFYSYDESSQAPIDAEFVLAMWCLADPETRNQALAVVAAINASVGQVKKRGAAGDNGPIRDYLIVPPFIRTAQCPNQSAG